MSASANGVHDRPGPDGLGSLTEVIRAELDRFLADERVVEASNHYRAVLSNVPAAVYRCAIDDYWTMVFLSAEAEEITGYPSSDFLGNRRRSFVDLIDPEDNRRNAETVAAALEKHEPYEIEYRLLHADGSTRWVHEKGQGCYDEHGRPQFLDGVIIDITRQHLAEEALRASEERLALALRAASSIVWDWSIPDGRVWYGPSLGKALGYGAEEEPATHEAFLRLLHSDDLDAVRRALDEHLTQGRPFFLEFRLRSESGEYRWFRTRGAVVRESGGKPLRMSGTLQDINDRKRAEEIERERNSLRDAVDAMRKVLGVVGHELRTPLAALRATTELLMECGPEAAASGEMIAAINHEVISMSEMVNNMLEAARLQSGMAEWRWTRFSLRQTCDAALAVVRPLVRDKPVQLNLHMDAADLIMRGDADGIRRLLINLVTNAVKHTLSGSVTVTASEFLDTGRRTILLEVEDTGRGIAPELLPRLGQAFALNAGAIGSDYVKGAGLGLAICKGIAAAHGGQMTLRSRPGLGTTILVRLAADLEGPASVHSEPLAIEGVAP